MSGGMIQLLFYTVFFFLLALLCGALLVVKRKLAPRKDLSRPMTLTRLKKQNDFEEGISRSQALIIKDVKMLENAPSVKQVEKQQQKKRAYNIFDKFKASRATRKQASTSQATPNIKSLRGRKV